jgi:peptide deformylase
MVHTAKLGLKILQIGPELAAKRLVNPAKIITDFHAKPVQDIIQRMLDTAKGLDRLGMAATQFDLTDYPVDQTPNIIVFRFPKEAPHQRYMKLWQSLDQKRFFENWQEAINLKTNPITDKKACGWEPCASFPGMVHVLRAEEVEYCFFDKYGTSHKGVAKGPFARLLQHEEDHIKGILNIMRIGSWNDVSLNSNVSQDQQKWLIEFFEQNNLKTELTPQAQIVNEDIIVKPIGETTEYDHSKYDSGHYMVS